MITAPTSTTNITGFFISVRGFSFRNESRTAPPTMPQSTVTLLSRLPGVDSEPLAGVELGHWSLAIVYD